MGKIKTLHNPSVYKGSGFALNSSRTSVSSMSTFASTNSPFIDGPLPPISPAEVNDHLHLLSAFYNFLREAILIYTTIHPSASRQDAYESITRRSAYRLELWVTTILKENVAANPKHRGFPIDGVPPFDVAMALLALMLSPHRFYEDSRLRLPQLQQIGDYPLSHLVRVIVVYFRTVTPSHPWTCLVFLRCRS